MSDPIERTGHYRNIVDVIAGTNYLKLKLACGHSVHIRTDTEVGRGLFLSMHQTAWKSWECQLCDGSEFIPEL